MVITPTTRAQRPKTIVTMVSEKEDGEDDWIVWYSPRGTLIALLLMEGLGCGAMVYVRLSLVGSWWVIGTLGGGKALS